MRELTVSLGARSYPIRIGPGLLHSVKAFGPDLAGKRYLLVTNEVVAPLYAGSLQEALAGVGAHGATVILPDGEMHKNLETLNRLYTEMLESRCDRSTVLVALGGGVIGDLAGFAAATYQRGVPFVQIPTTLLSQVDSSVGGKTGVNHNLGKNMIGAFWQPKLVIADTTVLCTLPEREYSAGMAEVIKYGLIRDISFLEWIERNVIGLMDRDPALLTDAIERSCANKAEVVATDEHETAKEGGRALLNLGHTFGHAIETGLGYGQWLHGEAVAAGTMIAAILSRRLGWISAAQVERIRTLMNSVRLPVTAPRLGTTRYLELMSHDKKVLDGQLRLVLLKSIGQAATVSGVPEAEISAAIEESCGA